ncbi:tetratricopeptide repeat protein [Solwaraspora sp. WMMD1047]|uniref:ATP-binding protein n=1 Tax=Solwaraspora sp. WMMD1047 TaxID=3016102 RepID=UPI002415AD53|nr:tetratricopeptide repeat protein [Solwaraspora sp. WMMD1047]MDG4831753.1 tetratricopeptide repeat protein [Solwaraspora sp. WMMD1047]
MADRRAEAESSGFVPAAAEVRTTQDLARLLRELRRREARQEGAAPLTYRALAAKTGWSRGILGEYFRGQVLAPTDRFDVLIRVLGATPAEQRALATARDRIEEERRRPARATAGPDEPGIPRQLPPAPSGFVGRQAQLAQLDALLDPDRRGPAAPVAVLSGTAGAGKTTLAVHWAHRVRDRFPAGQLYLDLRGFAPSGPAMAADEAVRSFLEALGVRPERLPVNLAAQVGRYRSLLADRRVLIVLDNAHDADQVRPLLPGTDTCLVVVTSRSQLSGLVAAECARPIEVDLLTPAEAGELLTNRLGPERMTGAAPATSQIVERCARLPLALAVVAARAAAHPRFPLAVLARELTESSHGLTPFEGGDPSTDVRAVFSWSYRQLSPEAGRLFRLLGLAPGPDISTAAAASLAGIPLDRGRRLLTELGRAHLVAEHSPGRFTFHDLLRAYAAELAGSTDPADDRRDAARRFLDHLLHTAHAAALLLQPGRDPIVIAAAQPGCRPERPADYREAFAWFTAEHRTLLAAAGYAAETGHHAYAWQLAWTMVDFFQRRGHWHDQATTQRAGLAAARLAGDRAGQANTHRDLARAYARLHRYAEADTHFRYALDLFEELSDLPGKARTHRALGSMLDVQGRHHDALHHARQALDLYRAAGDLVGQASTLNAVGWAHAMLGDNRQALAYCQRALPLLRRTGDRHGEANTWDSLGYAHHQLGDYPEAVRCYQRSLAMYREIGEQYDEADTLTRLGETHLVAGQPGAARQVWRRAQEILDQLGHPAAEKVRARLARLG